jgi:hypothetical protein
LLATNVLPAWRSVRKLAQNITNIDKFLILEKNFPQMRKTRTDAKLLLTVGDIFRF